MTRRVYKYGLRMSAHPQRIHIPEGGVVRHVGKQSRDGLEIWVEVDVSKGVAIREFRIVGTGDGILPHEEWRGTVFDGPFVWHVYEVERT